MTGQPLLQIKDLQVAFNLPEGRVEVVKGVSFEVPKSKTVALVGESGSGKSVISQAIMRILPRAAEIAGGEILFHDPKNGQKVVDLAALDPDGDAARDIRGGRISIIFQEPMTSLSPVHTVGNQITESLKLHRTVGQREANSLAAEMLGLVGFPDPVRALKTYPFELSGGLRQRAMIAMALVCHPALLIADEPTTALDVTIQAQILKLLKDLQDELEMAVLMITHDLGVVANVADEVVVLYRGEVMESGPKDDLFSNPQHPYLQALAHAVPRFDLEPGERLVPIREIKTGHAKNSMIAVKEDWTGEADEAGPLLDVQSLTKSFRIRKGSGAQEEVLAVDDVSFTLKRGECLGLVGESGCGKTTLSKMIMRALTPDSGSVTFNNRGELVDVLALEGEELKAFRPHVQFVFQDPYSSLNPRMTVADIIAEPLLIHDIGDRRLRRQVAEQLLEVVGLNKSHLNRYPHSFSGGQRQRVGIARALALKPDLLICDEPVSALDVSIQAQILNLLLDLRSELGLSYLFISHNLAVVDYIADRIAVMCRGRLVEMAPREMLFRDPVHPYTQALLSAVPDPDLDKPLDLKALMEGKTSEPAAWPAPFTIDGTTHPHLVHLGEGHYVRADPESSAAPSAVKEAV